MNEHSPIQAKLLERSVVRAAAWSIETVSGFEAPDLVKSAATLLEAERKVLARRDAAVAILHNAVPRIADGQTRAYLLAVKRKIYNSTLPLPEPSSEPCVRFAENLELENLLAEERSTRLKLSEYRAKFEQLYAVELDRQRGVLKSIAGTSRFRKALLIANPFFTRRWLEKEEKPGVGTARARRTEATIFHYLMRAIGRATPFGAWAGVAAVSPAPEGNDAPACPLQVKAIATRYNVNLNLAPFELILRSMAKMQRYRRRYPLRLNLTLHREGDGWRYERDENGLKRWDTLADHPLYSHIIHYYSDLGARPSAPWIETVCAARDDNPRLREVLEQLLDSMVDRDILRSELTLPRIAASPWEALERSAQLLVAEDRVPWLKAITTLRELCVQLATSFDYLEPVDIDRMMQAIEAEVQRLWDAVDLPGKVPAPVVFMDMRLPFAVSWTRKLRLSVERAIRSLLAFNAGDGGAELYRRLSLQDIIRACGISSTRSAAIEIPLLSLLARGDFGWELGHLPKVDSDDPDPLDMPDTRENIFARLAQNSELRIEADYQCREWEQRLEPLHSQRAHMLSIQPTAHPVVHGPSGTVLLRLAGDTELWIGTARPELSLFGSCVTAFRDENESLFTSLDEHASLAVSSGVTPIEIIGEDIPNPNAGMRVVSFGSMLNPHGTPGIHLHDLNLVIDLENSRPWLRMSQMPTLFIPVYNAIGAIGFNDPCSRLLLTLARAHGWEFLAFGFPALRAERTRWHHLPRLMLPPDGAVLSPERWTLERETVARLVDSTGHFRYLAWRAEVERLELPKLVHVQCGPAAPKLLMCTESPLAVRCLFDTVAVKAPWINITELPGDPGRWLLKDSDGEHYFAEFAATWYADEYWKAVALPNQSEATKGIGEFS